MKCLAFERNIAYNKSVCFFLTAKPYVYKVCLAWQQQLIKEQSLDRQALTKLQLRLHNSSIIGIVAHNGANKNYEYLLVALTHVV